MACELWRTVVCWPTAERCTGWIYMNVKQGHKTVLIKRCLERETFKQQKAWLCLLLCVYTRDTLFHFTFQWTLFFLKWTKSSLSDADTFPETLSVYHETTLTASVVMQRNVYSWCKDTKKQEKRNSNMSAGSHIMRSIQSTSTNNPPSLWHWFTEVNFFLQNKTKRSYC